MVRGFPFPSSCEALKKEVLSQKASYSENLIKIPTLHLHGTKDIQYEPGKQQLENYFEPASTRVWDIAYHHAMPWHRADVLRLVDLMRGLYKDTKDKA